MLIDLPYRSDRAVEYALRWALARNPLFPDFAGIGGDCTNFVSQCVLAGCCVFNLTPDFGWYYLTQENRAPAWSGVSFFYDFITGRPEFSAENGGIGPYGIDIGGEMPRVGDIVQLANDAGVFYHTLIITGMEGEDPLVSAHTNDARNRPLSTYTYATARYLRVLGARLEADNEPCFHALLEGRAFLPLNVVTEPPLLTE